MKFLIIIGLLVVVTAAVLMLLRPSGPRITTIERRDEIDEREDRD